MLRHSFRSLSTDHRHTLRALSAPEFDFVVLFCSAHCKHLCGGLVLLREPQRPHIITRMLSTRPCDEPPESGLYCSDCTNLGLLARASTRACFCMSMIQRNFSMAVLIPQCRKWCSRAFLKQTNWYNIPSKTVSEAIVLALLNLGSRGKGNRAMLPRCKKSSTSALSLQNNGLWLQHNAMDCCTKVFALKSKINCASYVLITRRLRPLDT